MKKILAVMTILSVLVSGCASTTLLNTAPQGAKVYLDGRLLGVTPIRHTDTAVSGSTKTVRIKKEGFKDETAIIRKEEVKIGPIIGGIFFLFPFIWTLGYPDSYTFELEPESD